jgi:hypothetical protein
MKHLAGYPYVELKGSFASPLPSGCPMRALSYELLHALGTVSSGVHHPHQEFLPPLYDRGQRQVAASGEHWARKVFKRRVAWTVFRALQPTDCGSIAQRKKKTHGNV